MRIQEILNDIKEKKIAIDDVVTSYSSKKESHKSSWPHLLKCQLSHMGIESKVLTKNDNIHEYDVWLISLPMEFQGTFNLFGGATEDVAERVKRIKDFKGTIYILNHDMPDIGDFIKSREKGACESWKEFNSDEYTQISKSIQRIDLILDSDTFIYGDSHCVSVYEPGANISRNDGQTLYGFLNKRNEFSFPKGTRNLVLYMGNIDIRHHIFRQKDPMESLRELVKQYVEFVKELKEIHKIESVTLVDLLPIEHEERKIPKTGWYKGSPYFGTRQQRADAVKEFNKLLNEYSYAYDYTVISWPKEWYVMDPEKYAEEYMEKPGSVHLSRSSYLYDFETGKSNRKTKIVALF